MTEQLLGCVLVLTHRWPPAGNAPDAGLPAGGRTAALARRRVSILGRAELEVCLGADHTARAGRADKASSGQPLPGWREPA
jgi:hypothetical protein